MSFQQRITNLEKRLRPLTDTGAAAIHSAMDRILSNVGMFDVAARLAEHVQAHGIDRDAIPLADVLAARLEGATV